MWVQVLFPHEFAFLHVVLEQNIHQMYDIQAHLLKYNEVIHKSSPAGGNTWDMFIYSAIFLGLLV